MVGYCKLSAVKSGKHIYVQGVITSFEQISLDINDPLYCSWDAPTKALTIFGTSSNIRYLRFRNGCVFNSIDGETLQFSNATPDDTRMYIDAGADVTLNGDTTINGTINTVRPSYWYIYGRLTCVPDLASNKRATFKNFYRIYMYETSNANAYTDDIWDFSGAIMGSSAVNNGHCFYFAGLGKIRPHIFKNMIFDERIGLNNDTYGFYFTYFNDFTAVTFENIESRQNERIFQSTSGAIFKTKGCSSENTSTSWACLHYGGMASDARDFKKFYGDKNTKPYGQVFAYHEDFTFKSGNNNYKLNTSYNSQVMIKDCTFERASGDSIESKYQGRTLQWTGNTFADSNPEDIGQAGELSEVFRLQITVQDENNTPVEDAIIIIEQHDKKETFTFTTNDDGMMHAIYDLKGVMLTWKSHYTNSSNELWSTELEPHRVKVLADGYEPYQLTKHMDQDRSESINLIPLSSSQNQNGWIEGNSQIGL